MNRKCKFTQTQIEFPAIEEGKSLEETLRQLVATNEPIEVDTNVIYNEKGAGVDPATDIRTDKFSLACDATDKYARSEIAKSVEKPIEKKEE